MTTTSDERAPRVDPADQAFQRRLAQRVQIPRAPALLPARPRVLALDVQYEGEWGHVGAVLHRAGENERRYGARVPVPAEYVPGAFCFREGPVLLATLAALRARGETPEVLVIDGHGLAHPRRFGVACYVGVGGEVPSIGCAKRTLLRYEGEPGQGRGGKQAVELEGEAVGWVLRTATRVKPVYVSPGHLVSLEQAAALVLDLPGKCRVPDPLRTADQVARRGAKGETKGWTDLGTLEPRSLEV